MWDSAKTVLGVVIIILNIYMRKEGRLPINYLNFHLKKLEKRRANEIQRKEKNQKNKDQDGNQ